MAHYKLAYCDMVISAKRCKLAVSSSVGKLMVFDDMYKKMVFHINDFTNLPKNEENILFTPMIRALDHH